MSQVNVLDTGAAYSVMQTPGGLDMLILGDAKVVITRQVYDEILRDFKPESYGNNQMVGY